MTKKENNTICDALYHSIGYFFDTMKKEVKRVYERDGVLKKDYFDEIYNTVEVIEARERYFTLNRLCQQLDIKYYEIYEDYFKKKNKEFCEFLREYKENRCMKIA